MNAQIEAINSALSTDSGEKLHLLLVNRSQKLRQTLDKVTACVSDRESKYAQLKDLREEMDAAMDALASGDEATSHRPVTKIAADVKRVNDSIDREIDRVYELISDADTLRAEVSRIIEEINAVPLVATAA